MNVALSGLPGAGKSTIGRRLARLLALPFFDSDAEIVRLHGPVAAIFAREGEPQFRRYESEVLRRLANGPACVIALGGGAVLAPENRALLRKHGVIVYLAISAEFAYRRVAHRSHRPLLGASPDLATVRRLLAQRTAAYDDNDFAIDAEGKSPATMAKRIARWYRERDTRGDAP